MILHIVLESALWKVSGIKINPEDTDPDTGGKKAEIISVAEVKAERN